MHEIFSSPSIAKINFLFLFFYFLCLFVGTPWVREIKIKSAHKSKRRRYWMVKCTNENDTWWQVELKDERLLLERILFADEISAKTSCWACQSAELWITNKISSFVFSNWTENGRSATVRRPFICVLFTIQITTD